MKAGELTDLAIDWLCREYPGSLVTRELSVADWGGASLDAAAITDSHIVGVEVKGAGDSPARLEVQGIKYPMVAREMWLLCDESIHARCVKKLPSGWGVLEIWEGCVRPRNRATRLGPEERCADGGRAWRLVRDDSRYVADEAVVQRGQAPAAMCGALWGDELRAIVRRRGLSEGGLSKWSVPLLTRLITDHLPAPEIHDEMIRCLRERVWRDKHVIDTRTRGDVGAVAKETQV